MGTGKQSGEVFPLEDTSSQGQFRPPPHLTMTSPLRSLQMEAELEHFHKQNTQLELNITELWQKLRATDQEMRRERQKVWAPPRSSGIGMGPGHGRDTLPAVTHLLSLLTVLPDLRQTHANGRDYTHLKL